MVIAEGARFVIKRHRSRTLFITIAVAVGVGAIPVILFQLLNFSLFGLLFQGIYLALAIPAVYTRLSGIQIFK